MPRGVDGRASHHGPAHGLPVFPARGIGGELFHAEAGAVGQHVERGDRLLAVGLEARDAARRSAPRRRAARGPRRSRRPARRRAFPRRRPRRACRARRARGATPSSRRAPLRAPTASRAITRPRQRATSCPPGKSSAHLLRGEAHQRLARADARRARAPTRRTAARTGTPVGGRAVLTGSDRQYRVRSRRRRPSRKTAVYDATALDARETRDSPIAGKPRWWAVGRRSPELNLGGKQP